MGKMGHNTGRPSRISSAALKPGSSLHSGDNSFRTDLSNQQLAGNDLCQLQPFFKALVN